MYLHFQEEEVSKNKTKETTKEILWVCKIKNVESLFSLKNIS